MRKLTVIVFLSGWLGWINIARGDDVSDPKTDSQTVQVSTQAVSTQYRQPAPQPETHKPQLRDVLLGPPAPSWRDVRRQSIR